MYYFAQIKSSLFATIFISYMSILCFHHRNAPWLLLYFLKVVDWDSVAYNTVTNGSHVNNSNTSSITSVFTCTYFLCPWTQHSSLSIPPKLNCVDLFSNCDAFLPLSLWCCVSLNSTYEKDNFAYSPFFLTDFNHMHVLKDYILFFHRAAYLALCIFDKTFWFFHIIHNIYDLSIIYSYYP